MLERVLNPESAGFHDKAWHVTLGGMRRVSLIVYADCEQGALDALIDSCAEDDVHVIDEPTEEDLQECIVGGNAGTCLNFELHEMHIKQVTIVDLLVEVQDA
jgi:hypothetical protein